MPSRDIHDVDVMAQLDSSARARLEVPERIADAFIGEVFAANGNEMSLDAAFTKLAIDAEQAVSGCLDAIDLLIKRAEFTLSIELPVSKPKRSPFQWPLQFPEVFFQERPGFDSIIGNHPYYAGAWLGSSLGLTYISSVERRVGKK